MASLREELREIAERALKAVEPGACVERAVAREGDWVRVGSRRYRPR